MINFLIITLIFHYLVFFVVKKKSNVLYCGIFGQAADLVSKINESNIKILGLFNETRGKHSCGITYDGEIYHGLDKNKLFTDFIKHNNFKIENFPVVIGHTRSASSGTVNHFNSHPFGFGQNKESFEFIGVHNGTLYNHETLAKTFNVSLTDSYYSDDNVLLTRTKIDSEILLQILYENPNDYSVLEQYQGKAALVWTDTKEPNVIYLYSGMSRMTEAYVQGQKMEERPMNVWTESENNFYFSSLKEPLYCIGGKTEDVVQIEYNTVYKITDGDFANAEKTEISRDNCFQTETYVHNAYHGYNKNFFSKKTKEEIDAENFSQTCDFEPEKTKHYSSVTGSINIYNDDTLYPSTKYLHKVYSKKLRYYYAGTLIQGVFIYIANFGFYYVGENDVEADKKLNDIRGKYFDYNLGLFKPIKVFETDKIIYDSEKLNIFKYYFYEGISLKTSLDYTVLTSSIVKKNTRQLSFCSKHPIIDICFAFKPSTNQEIFLDGKLFTGDIKSVGFEKIYTVFAGNLVRVEEKTTRPPITRVDSIVKETKPVITNFNPNVLSEARTTILAIEKEILDEEERSKDNNELENITELLNETLTPQVESWQTLREELNSFDSKSVVVKDAKKLVNDLIKVVNDFINLNV